MGERHDPRLEEAIQKGTKQAVEQWFAATRADGGAVVLPHLLAPIGREAR